MILSTTVSLDLGSMTSLHPSTLLLATSVGLIAGVTSGLCGVSPGGSLVVLATLLLGAEQHVAQSISLAAQIPPTSVAGFKQYQAPGSRYPMRWLLWLASGFLIGGAVGAIGATHVSSSTLQWCYVAYLGILDALFFLRSTRRQVPEGTTARVESIRMLALLTVGLLAGLSSGYLGIGGGLAIVAGLAVGLKVPQHQAQRLSLAIAIVPTTAPAAYIYWREGLLPSWPILVAVIVGLWGGTDLGGRVANRVSPTSLRRILIVMVTAMTAYMAWRALVDPHLTATAAVGLH
jgi:uncharacterized protein